MSSTQSAPDIGSALGSMRPILLRLARHFAGQSDAEDLVQEAMTRALERRAALRPETNFRAWMKPVIRNLAIDESRRKRRLQPLEEAGIENPSSMPPAPAWSLFCADDVRRALERCPHELRTAFELHYWQMLPLDVIASQLGVARATVGTRLFRARAHVRRALERDARDRSFDDRSF